MTVEAGRQVAKRGRISAAHLSGFHKIPFLGFFLFSWPDAKRALDVGMEIGGAAAGCQ